MWKKIILILKELEESKPYEKISDKLDGIIFQHKKYLKEQTINLDEKELTLPY